MLTDNPKKTACFILPLNKNKMKQTGNTNNPFPKVNVASNAKMKAFKNAKRDLPSVDLIASKTNSVVANA